MYKMDKMESVYIVKIKALVLIRLKNKYSTERKPMKRRWGVRPVLRERNVRGEYVITFLKYKELDHEWFFLYTRMTPVQFDELLSIVGPVLTKRSHREALSPAQRLAMTLRFLSQGDSMFSIASGYKVGRSTASTVIKETTEALWETLNKIVLKPLIDVEDFKRSENQFMDRWNLPHTLGAIDGKHVAIQCPPNSGSEFFNYKKHFSIVLLAVCDAHYNFTYVDIGAFGSQSDGGVLANSLFGKSLDKLKFNFPEESPLPRSNIKMPYFFVGDDAFPLGKHLMKPYKGANLDLPRSIFNYRLSRARRVIENAFGILVSRWRIFTRTITSSPSTVDSIIKATVCLHNFIKKKEYNMPDAQKKYCPPLYCDGETDDGIVEGQWRREIGSNFNVVLEEINKTGSGGNNPGKQALNLREQLKNYLISPAGAISGQVKYVTRGKKRNQQ